MDPALVSLASVAVTGLAAYGLHKRETKKDTRVGEVATAALHDDLNIRMKAHVEFVETRMMAERKYYEDKLEEERTECDERINNIAGRLGIAEGRLRKLQRTESSSD